MSFRFIKFQVYQDAKLFYKNIVNATKNYPGEFYYLRDQTRRSSLSIILQIAEGSAKRSDKDFNRYLEIAMGSGNETAASLDVALDNNLIDLKTYRDLIVLCESVVNQLGGFSKKLKVGD